MVAAILKCWRWLLARAGFRRNGLPSLIVNLMLIAAFGVLIPYRRGYDFFDPIVIFAYTAIALLLSSAYVTDLMANGMAQAGLNAPVVASSMHGWVTLAIIYALGITTLNVVYRRPGLLHPDWQLLGSALLFALAGSLFFAASSALLAMLFSPRASRTTIRVVFLLLLLGWAYGTNYLPVNWQHSLEHLMVGDAIFRTILTGCAVLGILAAALMYAFSRRR